MSIQELHRQTIIQEIYTKAVKFAQQSNQTVGEKNDYYLTIEQLEVILKSIQS